ncbi:MAG: class I SAM-dependent methyltransferase [Bacilli bacterium]|nr:class I SAM-dependent methyltransferase [Bacilli bacterium]
MIDKDKMLAYSYDFYNQHMLQNQNLDIDYYKKQIKKYNIKKVLIVGAGTGRIALPLSKITKVDALDLDQSRLNILKEKNNKINTYCIDFTKNIIPKKYDMIIVPYSTFQLFGSYNNIKKGLHNANNLLSLKGILIFDVSESFNNKPNSVYSKLFEDYSKEYNTQIEVYKKSKKYKEYISFVTYFYFAKLKIKVYEKEKYLYYKSEKLMQLISQELIFEKIDNGYGNDSTLHKHIYYCRKR